MPGAALVVGAGDALGGAISVILRAVHARPRDTWTFETEVLA